MVKENSPKATQPSEHASSLHPRLAWMICYEETGSAQEVCKRFSISRKTFYKWLKRYRKSGGDTTSLVDQSRRPHHFPSATPESSVQLLKRLKEQTGFGQRRLKAILQEKHNIKISERTIWKILKRLEEAESSARPVIGVAPDMRNLGQQAAVHN
ncbi:MAG: helix-turn-helix domain-containing protein [Bacteroidota bacterium]